MDYSAAYSRVARYAAGPATDAELQHLLKTLANDQRNRDGGRDADHTFRGVVADKLQELGRDREAALLRDGHPVRVSDTLEQKFRFTPHEIVPDYPSHSWPGGGPILYFLEGRNGGTFCANCMNENARSRAESLSEGEEPDEFTPHRDKYTPFVHEEGRPEVCDGCGAETEALYGDPDNPEDE